MSNLLLQRVGAGLCEQGSFWACKTNKPGDIYGRVGWAQRLLPSLGVAREREAKPSQIASVSRRLTRYVHVPGELVT